MDLDKFKWHNYFERKFLNFEKSYNKEMKSWKNHFTKANIKSYNENDQNIKSMWMTKLTLK